MSDEREYTFDVTILPDLSPFKVNDPSTLPHEQEAVSAEGKKYSKYLVSVSPKSNADQTFRVLLFKRDADRIRVLQMLQPDGYLTATFNPKKSEEDFDTVSFGLLSMKRSGGST